MPLTAADVHALDANAEALGVPVTALMARAGEAVADLVMTRWPEGTVVVLVGSGNNGGDGLVAARLLAGHDRTVSVVLSAPAERIRSPAARAAWEAWERLEGKREGLWTWVWSASDTERSEARAAIDGASVVVDAMLGVGASGPLRGSIRELAGAARGRAGADDVHVVAVDLPTGHGGPDAVWADVTVTFHDRKVGMEPGVCGDIVVAPIGIPPEAERYVGVGDLLARYPRSKTTGHKGDHGSVFVVAGGPYRDAGFLTTGAAYLTAAGALATGIDRLNVATPTPAVSAFRTNMPEAVVTELEGVMLRDDHVELILQDLGRADVLLLGPGLGREPTTKEAIRRLVVHARREGIRLVLDADALNAVGGTVAAGLADTVLTPHTGEMSMLLGQNLGDLDLAARAETVKAWRQEDGPVVLVKGSEDLIVGDGPVIRNRVHHEVMTTGGTGDVLAGVVAAIMARGASPFDAARVGAWLNGRAGALCFQELGYGVKARDLIDRIPRVLGEHFGTPQRRLV